MATRRGLSIKKLQKLMADHGGMSARQLSLAVDMPPYMVSRLESSDDLCKTTETWRVAALADFFHCSIDDLFEDSPAPTMPRWIAAPWRDYESLRPMFDRLDKAKKYCTITSHIEPYLLPEPMAELVYRSYCKSQGWLPSQTEAFLAWAKPKWAAWGKTIGNSQHRYHYMPDTYFREAARVEPRWIAEVAERLEQYKGRVQIYIADEERWEHIRQLVAEKMGESVWTRIGVGDKRIVHFRPTVGRYEFSVHPEAVKIAWAAIRDVRQKYSVATTVNDLAKIARSP